MKSHYRAVVIGGGVVGASVLYHLAKLGWTDVILVERAELTAGSTWHAAGGFHAINADPNIAALQDYTIRLYREIEAESGYSVGLHMTGGLSLAGTAARWEWLKSAWAMFRTMGIETARLITPEEIRELCPIADTTGLYGGIYDSNEGHLDPYGATHAYVGAARKRGAAVVLHNRVLALESRADGSWNVVTELGTIVAEHVVNAAGLWAKQVGLMAGVDLPVTPMEHHYLLTEPIPEVAALSKELPLTLDLEGFTYLRHEGKGGVLLGVYELTPKHWHVDGAPWDYGMDLIPEDIERIAPELERGFERFPCLKSAGIKRWVNGAFTFTPDGNPLVGPVPGRRNYWVACGVMAGFSQGGGVGLALAQWMIHGEPGSDIYGMDVARYGSFASNREYLKATTAQFYKRRFVLTYPNEQLPAGRPLRRTPSYDAMTAAGARWGASWGLEIPLYFAPAGFVETPTQRRSNAHDIVGAECRAVRSQAGLLDISAFARYEIRGPGARDWLDNLLACKIPSAGKARLAPMLSPSAHLMGDLTVFNWDDDTFWIMGSYYLRQWHLRWFQAQTPPAGVSIRDISDTVLGFAVVGPRARELLARVTDADVANAAFGFMSCREMDVGLTRARVARLSVTGELGYEINVAAGDHQVLGETLLEAGRDLGLVQIGFNAVLSLRLEKSFGIWTREFTSGYTPKMSGMDRFIAFEKGPFIGRDAARGDRDANAPGKKLVTLHIHAEDADAVGFEPVWLGDRLVGFVTSGGYGHCVQKSLALAYLEEDVLREGAQFDVHVVGEKRRCTLIAASPYDPANARLRS
jgi:dimethylglycine dehydrogenase